MNEEDSVLVKRFKLGEEKAFDLLFERYQRVLYTICYRYTRNEADARELTQDIFIKVYRNLKKFNEKCKFFTWLYRIAVNTCLSFNKRKHRDEVGLGEYIPHQPERDILLKKAIEDALEKLPGRQRMVFILRHYQGYKFEELAKIMNISVGAAKAHHFQALKKLRVFLKDWL
uniref:Sigma-70 family RNA polymerase sigma factor n=1 Tax=candidate division WOR-3 bacterium TaxID=2052148 RepID=A0A7C4TAF6_UNCW3